MTDFLGKSRSTVIGFTVGRDAVLPTLCCLILCWAQNANAWFSSARIKRSNNEIIHFQWRDSDSLCYERFTLDEFSNLDSILHN